VFVAIILLFTWLFLENVKPSMDVIVKNLGVKMTTKEQYDERAAENIEIMEEQGTLRDFGYTKYGKIWMAIAIILGLMFLSFLAFYGYQVYDGKLQSNISSICQPYVNLSVAGSSNSCGDCSCPDIDFSKFKLNMTCPSVDCGDCSLTC
jgi:hypothetical protein